MTKIKFIIPVILSVLVLNSSCLRHKIEGNYHVTTEERAVSSFTQLTSEGDYDVYYSYSPNYSVSIEAESNLIPFIQTDIKGNDIVIRTQRNKRFDNHFPIKVFVQAPYINEVSLSGSGKIEIDSATTESFTMVVSGSGSINAAIYTSSFTSKVSGSGHIYLTGYADQTDIDISGSGNIDSYDFIQGTCNADISGSGKMKVYVNDVLNAHISGSGTIYYRGNPQVNSHITGSGRIIHQ